MLIRGLKYWKLEIFGWVDFLSVVGVAGGGDEMEVVMKEIKRLAVGAQNTILRSF